MSSFAVMSDFRKICWTTALLLLMVAAIDLLVVDFAWSFVCDDGQAPNSSSTVPDDDCFCCCAHIDFVSPVVFLPEQLLDGFEPITSPSAPSRQPSPVYHPPRA